jgi:hypothetical protein
MINISPSSQTTKIYLITNCYGDPNKIYIGKTRNSRRSNHKKTYGKGIIYTEIDEINSLNPKDWKPLECFWIEYFRQLGFDLQNKNKGGGGPQLHTKETISKRLEKIYKPILQYNLNGEFIKEWKSVKHIEESLGYYSIYTCLRSKYNYSNGFIWIRKYENYPTIINVKNRDKIIRTDEFKNKISKANKNKLKPNGFGDIIRKQKIGKLFSDETKLKQSLAKIGIRKSEETKQKMSDSAEYKKTKVLQYTLDGKFVREWGSCIEVIKELGILGVSGVCRGKCKQSGGFVWKYKDK